LLLALFLKPLIFPSAFFLIIFLYFLYSRFLFSPRGKNIQKKIQAQLLETIQWDGKGKALDIGCGSGALTIMLAKKFPLSHITGVDNWGTVWEYSKKKSEENARIEGVSERVVFQKASATSLPFDDHSFNAVVSNLTFHEVHDCKDKRRLLQEALRIIPKGGFFTFQDLFLWKAVYGDINELIDTIKSWGIEKVEFINTSNLPFIPKLLKLPFMVGTIGIIFGKK